MSCFSALNHRDGCFAATLGSPWSLGALEPRLDHLDIRVLFSTFKAMTWFKKCFGSLKQDGENMILGKMSLCSKNEGNSSHKKHPRSENKAKPRTVHRLCTFATLSNYHCFCQKRKKKHPVCPSRWSFPSSGIMYLPSPSSIKSIVMFFPYSMGFLSNG